MKPVLILLLAAAAAFAADAPMPEPRPEFQYKTEGIDQHSHGGRAEGGKIWRAIDQGRSTAPRQRRHLRGVREDLCGEIQQWPA